MTASTRHANSLLSQALIAERIGWRLAMGKHSDRYEVDMELALAAYYRKRWRDLRGRGKHER